MFEHIAVAIDASHESERALKTALQLARQLGRSLTTITIREPVPAFAYLASLNDSSTVRLLQESQEQFYKELMENAARQGEGIGVATTTHLVDGDRVDQIVQFVADQKIDLLVLGLHRSSIPMHSLWSTVCTLAQDLTCSMLGVH